MSTAKHTFFCPHIDDGYLSEEESNHAVRVLRLKEKNEIRLIDGNGSRALATINDANKRKLGFVIIESETQEAKQQNIHIAIAPTKNMDRFNFFMEKVIEIGINRITPIITSNSERKTVNIDKLRKAAISAIKQSGNLYLPIIDDLLDFSEFVDGDYQHTQKFIAHCESDITKKEFKSEIDSKKNILILIGPEGDFTPEEINLAKENHFLPVSLGESRLRTETAGIVACHTVNII